MKPYHRNPRQITQKRFDRLTDTLARLGDLGGIVHNVLTDEIIGGNQRTRVFGEATQIEIVEKLAAPDEQGTVAHGFIVWRGHRFAYRQVQWDEDTAAEANIRANVGAGDWDWDVIANQWDATTITGWGLDADLLSGLKCDIAALGNLLESEEPEPADAEPQLDKADALQKKWGTATGQLWTIGNHRLLVGDSTKREDVGRVMQGEKADICVSDPPYGVLDEEWDRAFVQSDLEMMLKHTTGLVACFNAAKPAVLLAMLSLSPMPERVGVWRYSHIVPKPGMIWSWQPVFYWRCGDAVAWDSLDWFQGNADRDGTHPTQKPIEFFQKIITSVDCVSVFDPFVGSGTTIVACQNLSRRCRAIEISEKYCAVILERMATAFPGISIERVTDGQTTKQGKARGKAKAATRAR